LKMRGAPIVRENQVRSGEDENETARSGGAGRPANRQTYVAVAGLAALGILGGLITILFLPSPGDESRVRTTRNKAIPRAASPRPILTLVLTAEERNEITTFLLDDQPQPLPPESELTLDAGRHRLILRRTGYQEVFDSITLVSGVHREYRPRWRREIAAVVPPAPGIIPPAVTTEMDLAPAEPTPLPAAGSPADTMNAEPAPSGPPLVQEPPQPATEPPELPLMAGPPSDAELRAAATGGFPSGFGRMVAHWPFDNDTGDKTGLRHDGLAIGAADYVAGRAGQALQFTPELRFEVGAPILNGASEFSFCLWMNLAGLPAQDAALISGETIVLFVRDGFPCVEIGGHKPLPGPGTDETTGGFRSVDLSAGLDSWIHLGLSYSARFRQLHYYVNGAHRGCQQYAETVPASWGRTIVTGVSGVLDDLRVFDYRLAGADFQAIVDGNFQPPPAPPRLPNGKLVCETWHDVSPAVSRLALESVLRSKPDQTSTIEEAISYLAAVGDGDCLACMQGFLFPPERGDYTLLLEASGQATLYLQRSAPAQDTLQEVVANRAGQAATSPRIELEANKPCYFKILHFYKADSGGAIRLGWQLPGSAERVDAVPAAHFGSYRPVP